MAEKTYPPPMRLRSWMDRLDKCKTPFLSIQGVADMATAMVQPDSLQRNTCYLAYASEAVMGADDQGTGLRRIEVAVVSALINRKDRRGEAVIEDLELARAALSTALLGWEPEGAAGAVSFRRGDVAAYTRKTLWWRDVYSVPAFAPRLTPEEAACIVPANIEAEMYVHADTADIGPPVQEVSRGRVWPIFLGDE